MTGPLPIAITSTAALDVERLAAESTVRLAVNVAKASEHFGVNTLGLWLRIAETRAVVERMGK